MNGDRGLILDTHIWIWWVDQDAKLSDALANITRRDDYQMWVGHQVGLPEGKASTACRPSSSAQPRTRRRTS